jgi:hypothetical protein
MEKGEASDERKEFVGMCGRVAAGGIHRFGAKPAGESVV